MKPVLDETHDSKVQSWVESANVAGSDFPVQNLPLGVFRRREAGAGFLFIRGDVGRSLAPAGRHRALAKARLLCRRRGQAQGRRPAVVAGGGRQRWRYRDHARAARWPRRRCDAGGGRSAGG